MAQISLYVKDELKQQIEAVARQERRSMSWMVQEWIQQGLKLRERQTAKTKEDQREATK